MSQPAMAQDDPKPAQGAPADDQSKDEGIGDIVVTARYVKENVQDTPMAITAQTQTQLEAANVTNIGTLGAVVPNLQTIPGDSQSAGTPKVRIRGVIQGETSSLAVPPAVAIYTDDVYHPTTAGSELDFTDVDRVEVNRGPQSTLSGNASIGGSIKLYTKDPVGDGSGFVTLTAGSRKKLGASGAIDLGLSDTLSLRALGNFERQDGFVDRLDFTCVMTKLGTPALAGTLPMASPASQNNDCVLGHEGGGTMAVGQIKLRWRPTNGIDLILTARHREENMEETPEVALAYVPIINGLPNGNAAARAITNAAFSQFGGIQLDNRFLAPAYTKHYATYATNCRPNYTFVAPDAASNGVTPVGYCFDRNKTAHNTELSAKLQVDLSSHVRVTAIGAYLDYANKFTQNGDQSPLGYVTSHFENYDHNYTAEVRFDGDLLDNKLKWVLGGFLMRFTGDQKNNTYFNTFALDTNTHGTNNNQSVFAHLDFNITDRWRVSGGGRYTDGKLAITIAQLRAPSTSLVNPVFAFTKRWDWLLSTDYKITDDILAYASAATGSRPPGLTTIVITPRQYQQTSEEDLISYEAGIKADLFDRRLRTNFAAFYTDYNKLSQSVTGIECTNQPGAVATWFPIAQNDPLMPTAAYCGQFPGTPAATNFTINLGIPAKVKGLEWEITAVPIDGLRLDWSGGYNKFTSGIKTAGKPGYNWPGNHRQPSWNMHADASYEIETGIGSFTPRIDWAWQSQQDYKANPSVGAPAGLEIIKPYSLWNAQLAYAAPDSKWSLTLSVTNLGDKFFYYQPIIGGLNTQVRVGAPREFSLTLRRTF
jgi:iron complex outermembrane receptor protein